MAMQTRVASSKVLILVGPGLTGSVILKSGRLSDVLLQLQELLKGVTEADIYPTNFNVAFVAQIWQLALEIRDLSLSNLITISNGSSTSSVNKEGFNKRLENLDWKLEEQKEIPRQ